MELAFNVALIARPFVEYKGTVPQNEMQGKQKDIELEANALISEGGKVSFFICKFTCLM